MFVLKNIPFHQQHQFRMVYCPNDFLGIKSTLEFRPLLNQETWNCWCNLNIKHYDKFRRSLITRTLAFGSSLICFLAVLRMGRLGGAKRSTFTVFGIPILGGSFFMLDSWGGWTHVKIISYNLYDIIYLYHIISYNLYGRRKKFDYRVEWCGSLAHLCDLIASRLWAHLFYLIAAALLYGAFLGFSHIPHWTEILSQLKFLIVN